MRVIGLCFKDVVVRFKGREAVGSKRTTCKVVRVEGINVREMALGVRCRPRWVLQVMRGRAILFEKKYATRREATTIARRLAYGGVDQRTRR